MSEQNYGEPNGAETQPTPNYSAPQPQPTPQGYQQAPQGYQQAPQGYQQAPQGFQPNGGYYGYPQQNQSGPSIFSVMFGSTKNSIAKTSPKLIMIVVAALLGVFVLFDSITSAAFGLAAIDGFNVGIFFAALFKDLMVSIIILFFLRMAVERTAALYKKDSDEK